MSEVERRRFKENTAEEGKQGMWGRKRKGWREQGETNGVRQGEGRWWRGGKEWQGDGGEMKAGRDGGKWQGDAGKRERMVRKRRGELRGRHEWKQTQQTHDFLFSCKGRCVCLLVCLSTCLSVLSRFLCYCLSLSSFHVCLFYLSFILTIYDCLYVYVCTRLWIMYVRD